MRDIDTTLELRQYQDDMITGIAREYGRGHKRIMLYAPTGSGKTETAAGILKRIWATNILPEDTIPYFIVERTTLCLQAKERFEGLGFKVGILQAENTVRTGDEDVVVASIQTLAYRYKQTLPPDMGMGIIDEAHLLFAMHKRLMTELNALLFVGMSATPLRAGLGAMYTAMVEGPAIKQCIDNGWLVKAKCYGPSSPDLSGVGRSSSAQGIDYNQKQLGSAMQQITGDIVSTWLANGEGRQTLCFAVNVAHAEQIAEQFRDEGIAAESVHYKMRQDDVAQAKKAFHDGDVRILITVMQLAIGFDAPEASCAILARPTLSESLHLQQLGRVLRPYDGKDNALVLDHAGNLARFGRPEDFVLPALDDGELDNRAKKARNSDCPDLVPCPDCFYMMEKFVFECPSCGHTRKRPVNIEVVDGELIDLDSKDGKAFKSEYAEKKFKREFYADLLSVADEKGYKKGWAAHQFKSRYGDWPNYKNVMPSTPSESTRRWVKSQYIRHAKTMAKKKLA